MATALSAPADPQREERRRLCLSQEELRVKNWLKYENQGGHEKEFWQKQVHVQRLGCMKSEVCLGKCIWLSDAARSMLGSGRTGDETAQIGE